MLMRRNVQKDGLGNESDHCDALEIWKRANYPNRKTGAVQAFVFEVAVVELQ